MAYDVSCTRTVNRNGGGIGVGVGVPCVIALEGTFALWPFGTNANPIARHNKLSSAALDVAKLGAAQSLRKCKDIDYTSL